jgi:acid phosphatase type 7
MPAPRIIMPVGRRRWRAAIVALLQLAAAGVVAAAPAVSAVDDIVVVPAPDATVRSAQPSTNFGTATTLTVDASPVVRGYVRLPVTGLTGPVDSATLQVFSSSSSTSGTALVVKAVSDNTWLESTITFNNAPPVGALLGSTPLTSGSYASVDVSSVVTGNGVYSFALETTSTSAKTLSSREGANPPRLVVETGPPGAVVAAAGDIACSPQQPQLERR